MADTYTTYSRMRLIERSSYPGTWDTPLNNDVIKIADAEQNGEISISIGSSTSYALAALVDGTLSDSHYYSLIFTGTPASAVTITIPASVTRRKYRIKNSTGQTITVKYSASTGVSIADELTAIVWCDGSEVHNGVPSLSIKYDITPAEIDALVTPTDYSYPEGHSRRYSTFAELCAVMSQEVEVHLWNDFDIASLVDTVGGVMVVHGNSTLTATATINQMLRYSGQLTIRGEGELLFDADTKVTYACLHGTNYLPNLKKIRFLDCNYGFLAGDSDDGTTYDNVLGDVVWDQVVAENCANVGWAARGHATEASRTAKIELRNCKTKGTTGNGNLWSSGVGYLHHLSGMVSVRYIGGDYTGATGAYQTHAYECNAAEILGGRYYNTGRGPTVGENTKRFVIQGTNVSGMADGGINGDTTNGTTATVGIGTINENVIANCGRAVRTTCSYVSVTNNEAYECVGDGAAFAFAGTGDSEVWLDGNHETSATASHIAFYAVGTTQVKLGNNSTNSTSRNAYFTDAGAKFIATQPQGLTRTLTSDGDLSGNDRVIVLDATAGAVDLDLFDATEIQIDGFEVLVFKKDATNNATITFQGAAANGETINGVTALTLYNSQQYQAYKLVCIDGAAGTWVAHHIELNQLQSGATAWDPGDLATGAINTTTITVTGAAVGDFVVLSFTQDLLGTQLSGEVTSANTVTVTQSNGTGSNQNVANGSLRALVFKKLG